jgi:nucleoid DNA-binding protein
MKNNMTFCLIAASGWLLAGCGDSSTKPTPPATSGAAPTVGSGAAEVATETKKQVTEAVAEVKKQATETVAVVQKQATEAYQNFSSQIASSLQSNSDSTLKNIGADLSARVSKFGDSIKTNDTVKAQLSSAMESLLGKNDAEAVTGLGKITDLKLSPEQSTLAKEVYNAGAALVTRRNFSSLEGMNSEVTSVVNSVWKGNYSQALPPLQKIWTQAKLTDSQKNLLGTTFDKYSPGWRDNAATVQKGLDTLKGFTK